MRAADPTVAVEVGEVLVRYAVDYSEVPGRGTLRWESADAITDWMATNHDHVAHTLHRITNIRVEHGADDDQVRALSYVDVVVTAEAQEMLRHAAGYDEDELTRGPNGWQIDRRRFAGVLSEAPTTTP